MAILDAAVDRFDLHANPGQALTITFDWRLTATWDPYDITAQSVRLWIGGDPKGDIDDFTGATQIVPTVVGTNRTTFEFEANAAWAPARYLRISEAGVCRTKGMLSISNRATAADREGIIQISEIDVAAVIYVGGLGTAGGGGGGGEAVEQISSLADPRRADSEILRFTKETSPILHADNWNKPTLYWPMIVRVEGLIPSPLGSYYLLFSTDHDPGDGGIGMAWSNSPLGPFTVANGGDPIFVDPGAGTTVTQIETPQVLWNPVTELFHLFYHAADFASGSQQRTRVVTTTDFVTFSAPQVALPLNTTYNHYPGAGIHTGYLRPYHIGGQWWGYSILTAGPYGAGAMWHSRDGLTWTIDPRPLGMMSDIYDDAEKMLKISFNRSSIFEINGRRWTMTGTVTFQSGITNFNSPWIMAQLSPDGRRLLGQPIDVTPPDVAWEKENRRNAESVLVEGNTVYAYYRATGQDDKHAIGVAVGTLP